MSQKYLGLAREPRVAAFIASSTETKSIPPRLRHLFWDVEPAKIDVSANSRYIIDRMLELGDLEALNWLQKTYPSKKILESLFLSRSISERSKGFWRLWFGVDALPEEFE